MAQVSHVRGALRGSSPKQGQYVFIATPTYTGKLDTNYVHALMYSMRRLDAEGIDFDHYVLGYNCHVDDSRNAIVRDFLATDCTDLVFIDADVSWEPEALVRLIKHDRDIVAGVYPKRQNNDENYPVWVEPGTVLQSDSDGLVEVGGAPTGFMKIKRHVLEKLVEANKHRQYKGQSSEPDDAPYTIVFERTFEDGHRWSGDYAFCRKWQKLGGKIHVDPEMFLYHRGEVEFSGTLGEFWKKKHGLLEQEKEKRFCDAIESIRRGDVSSKTWVDLKEGWGNLYAAEIELLAACYELAKNATGPILETGTGLTTFVMALANPNVQIHSLEHDPIWGSATGYRLTHHKINNVTIHCHPLKEYPDGKWYDLSGFPAEKFSIALCDGPPRRISNRAIFFQELKHHIQDAIVLVDDADGYESVRPIRDWAFPLGRGVTILGDRRRFSISAPMSEPTEIGSAS